MTRDGSFRPDDSNFSGQSPSTKVGKSSGATSSTMELLQNPTIANDFLHFAFAVQCSLGSLYLVMAMVLIRDCWAQQQQIRNAKRRFLEELMMKSSIRNNASNLQGQVQHRVIQKFCNEAIPTALKKRNDPSLCLNRKLPPAIATTSVNIRSDDRARRKFIQSKAFQAYRAHCASGHRNKETTKTSHRVHNLPPVVWSHLETSGMRAAKCSLLIQKDDIFYPQAKKLPKQRVRVDQDRGHSPDVTNCEARRKEDDHFFVDFEGCSILQLQPSSEIRRQIMPTTLTIGGRCIFTPESFRDFRVMMRSKQQSKYMNLQPNGDFDWPDVESLCLCPFCGRTAEVPRDGDDQIHEYWLLFYPLLQVTKSKGSQMVLGSRMICRLTCLDCMQKALGDTTCKVCPPSLNGRRARTSFMLPTKEVLGQAGSVSFLDGGPPMPETDPNVGDALDAWTLYNFWEQSGAWEALQNDYRLFLSRSMH